MIVTVYNFYLISIFFYSLFPSNNLIKGKIKLEIMEQIIYRTLFLLFLYAILRAYQSI
jgi:hypothetical protein